MLNDLYQETEKKMKKVIASTRENFAKIRTGRANPSILEDIRVDYYGTPTPINQMAKVSVPEAHLIVIQPWDKSCLDNIQKAIQKSDLNLNPLNDGEVIRLPFPKLTEERRKEIVKMINNKAEDQRIAIRNIRREANDEAKSLENSSDISEDEYRRALDRIQEITDDYIEKIDEMVEKKEKEIMSV